MKKVTSLLALVMAMIMLLVSCGNTGNVTTDPAVTTESDVTTTTDSTTVTTDTTTATTETPVCAHDWKCDEGTAPTTFEEGTGKFTCKLCGEKYEGTLPATKTIKILAIGNSFSVDAMETYLYNVLKGFGVETIVLGNLYIGGCSLDTHWNNMSTDAKAYEFQQNKSNKWMKSTRSVKYALQSEDWDVITIQQVSQNSGMPSTFGNLQNILNYIHQYKTNENAKVYWHMTWAYQGNSTHSGFANYGNSQDKMYEAITSTASTLLENYEGLDRI